MRVVLDTNVFFSALITPDGPPFMVIEAWLEKSFELITSRHQIDELKRVSRYARLRTRFARHEIGEVVNQMKLSVFIGPIPRKHTCDDPDDAFLLDLAEIGEADYLVTGDRKSGLIQMRKVGRASILSTTDFAKLLDP